MALLGMGAAAAPACREPPERGEGEGEGGAARPPAAADATEVAAARRLARRIAEDDFWYDRYHPYMDEALEDAYLATPKGERFERFGDRLIEFERREGLLQEERQRGLRLREEEEARYRRLPDVEACRAFLRARAREQSRNGRSDGPEGREGR